MKLFYLTTITCLLVGSFGLTACSEDEKEVCKVCTYTKFGLQTSKDVCAKESAIEAAILALKVASNIASDSIACVNK